MSENPTFVARKFQDAQKLAAKGYSCPLCSDTFHADQKLWEHAKTQHWQQLDLDVADEENARKRFWRDVIADAYVNTSCSFQV